MNSKADLRVAIHERDARIRALEAQVATHHPEAGAPSREAVKAWAVKFVTEQSEGEWGDDLIERDAERLTTEVRALYATPPREAKEDQGSVGKACGLPSPTGEAGGGTDDPENGWLPIVLCPTDGVDRALKLPDGREVVGAHHNPGGWRVTEYIEREEPVTVTRPAGFYSSSDPARYPKRQPEVVGSRTVLMCVRAALCEGVYPTHFRPNDTVYGDASVAPEARATAQSRLSAEGRSEVGEAEPSRPTEPNASTLSAMGEGWRLVPREPIRRQLDAMHDGPLGAMGETMTAETEAWLIEMYQAAVDAAPTERGE